MGYPTAIPLLAMFLFLASPAPAYDRQLPTLAVTGQQVLAKPVLMQLPYAHEIQFSQDEKSVWVAGDSLRCFRTEDGGLAHEIRLQWTVSRFAVAETFLIVTDVEGSPENSGSGLQSGTAVPFLRRWSLEPLQETACQRIPVDSLATSVRITGAVIDAARQLAMVVSIEELPENSAVRLHLFSLPSLSLVRSVSCTEFYGQDDVAIHDVVTEASVLLYDQEKLSLRELPSGKLRWTHNESDAGYEIVHAWSVNEGASESMAPAAISIVVRPGEANTADPTLEARIKDVSTSDGSDLSLVTDFVVPYAHRSRLEPFVTVTNRDEMLFGISGGHYSSPAIGAFRRGNSEPGLVTTVSASLDDAAYRRAAESMNWIAAIAWSASRRFVCCSCEEEPFLTLYDLFSGTHIGRRSSPIRSAHLQLVDDRPIVLVSDDDGVSQFATFSSTETERRYVSHRPDIYAATMSTNGRRIAAASRSGDIYVSDSDGANAAMLRQAPGDTIVDIEWTDDGDSLVCGYSNQRIVRWSRAAPDGMVTSSEVVPATLTPRRSVLSSGRTPGPDLLASEDGLVRPFCFPTVSRSGRIACRLVPVGPEEENTVAYSLPEKKSNLLQRTDGPPDPFDPFLRQPGIIEMVDVSDGDASRLNVKVPLTFEDSGELWGLRASSEPCRVVVVDSCGLWRVLDDHGSLLYLGNMPVAGIVSWDIDRSGQYVVCIRENGEALMLPIDTTARWHLAKLAPGKVSAAAWAISNDRLIIAAGYADGGVVVRSFAVPEADDNQ